MSFWPFIKTCEEFPRSPVAVGRGPAWPCPSARELRVLCGRCGRRWPPRPGLGRVLYPVGMGTHRGGPARDPKNQEVPGGVRIPVYQREWVPTGLVLLGTPETKRSLAGSGSPANQRHGVKHTYHWLAAPRVGYPVRSSKWNSLKAGAPGSPENQEVPEGVTCRLGLQRPNLPKARCRTRITLGRFQGRSRDNRHPSPFLPSDVRVGYPIDTVPDIGVMPSWRLVGLIEIAHASWCEGVGMLAPTSSTPYRR